MTHVSPAGRRKEHPSTYVVQDRSNEEELRRLDEQDRLFTRGMEGVLPEQNDAAKLLSLLDVGCGPGGWLIETARTYPNIKQLVGVDISARMIEYAQEQAQIMQVSERVHFQTGDALRMLEFPSNFFHLVNHRFAMSWVRKWDWPKLLREYQRVCSPGGTIRVTGSSIVETNSQALSRFMEIGLRAFWQAGHFVSPRSGGVIDHLEDLLHQYGIEEVQTRRMVFHCHQDPQFRLIFAENMLRASRTLKPFFRKWVKIPDDYEEMTQQLEYDMQQPKFEARQTLLTAWGRKRRV